MISVAIIISVIAMVFAGVSLGISLDGNKAAKMQKDVDALKHKNALLLDACMACLNTAEKASCSQGFYVPLSALNYIESAVNQMKDE